MQPTQLYLSRLVVVRVLAGVAVFLVMASVAGQLSRYLLGRNLRGLVPLFFVGREQNVPTFFSALLMILACLLLAVIATLARKARQPDVSKWIVLSAGFLFMAFDELSSLHERLVAPGRALLGGARVPIFHFTWVIFGIALVLALWLFFLPFLSRIPAATRRMFVIAAALFLGGALGVEMIGGAWVELRGPINLTYTMITTVEESLELAGLIVFLYALLGYIGDTYREVGFRFVPVGDDGV